jgi:outer membrane protein assembly factor BamD
MGGVKNSSKLLVVLLSVFLICASAPDQEDSPGFWQKLKAKFKKEKPLPNVEEVFLEAEENFNGRETWFGRLVKKSFGEDSKQYEKTPGVTRLDYTRAMELYQNVSDNYPFSKYAPLSDLKIADCHFKLEQYLEAEILYRQFLRLYPKRTEASYALFQQGMCHYNQILKAPRDQQASRDGADVFLAQMTQYPDSEYYEDSKKYYTECRTRIAEHELLIADFYFKKKDYWAASARYRGLWQNFQGLGYSDLAMFKEGSCYFELGKNDLALSQYDVFVRTFPDSEYIDNANERINSLNSENEENKE